MFKLLYFLSEIVSTANNLNVHDFKTCLSSNSEEVEKLSLPDPKQILKNKLSKMVTCGKTNLD